jgi:predicted ArsR family transcriptional regulator
MLTEEQHYLEMAKLVKAFRERFCEEVNEAAVKYFGKLAFAEWKAKAEENGNNSIEDFIKLFWEPLRERSVEYEVEKTPSGFQIKCTRCTFYELAKYNEVTDEGFYLACATDPYIVEGFNPNIGFKRTKTLMQGHDCCNHFYYLKDK